MAGRRGTAENSAPLQSSYHLTRHGAAVWCYAGPPWGTIPSFTSLVCLGIRALEEAGRSCPGGQPSRQYALGCSRRWAPGRNLRCLGHRPTAYFMRMANVRISGRRRAGRGQSFHSIDMLALAANSAAPALARSRRWRHEGFTRRAVHQVADVLPRRRQITQRWCGQDGYCTPLLVQPRRSPRDSIHRRAC